jgi:hypothetical protein
MGGAGEGRPAMARLGLRLPGVALRPHIGELLARGRHQSVRGRVGGRLARHRVGRRNRRTECLAELAGSRERVSSSNALFATYCLVNVAALRAM